jgi:extracellular factor (EF) 3-hydroxypalmitic acid methyl ester biosynthesis protein
MHHADELTSPHDVARRVGLFWKKEIPAWLERNLDVGPLLDRGLAELATTGLWGPANREPSLHMWQEAGEVLQHGWLQWRAREKPRGYAGDYEMLGAIYQSRVTADPRGRSFDEYFLRQAAPQAVRNRMAWVRDEILAAGNDAKVVVIGSGAGLEVAAALRASSFGRGEFWLLDLDPEAVALAEKNLSPLLPPGNLHCLAENLVRLPKKRRLVESLQDASLIVCTGFFDYLEDPQAVELLTLFWRLLRSGGRALVFNFAPWNSTRAYMEWIGNWYLLYRTRADLARLARSAEIPAESYAVTAEATGIDLLLTLCK